MLFNCKMGYSGNEQDYQLIKTSISELKKSNNQKDLLRYLTNVLPNPTDVVILDNAQDTVKSVKAQLANKNLLPYPYVETTTTKNGITFTVNGDGSITVNGTASGVAVFQLFNLTAGSKPMNVANKTITISGCPSGGSPQSYFLFFSYGGNTYMDLGDGITTTPNADIDAIRLRIAEGATVNNLTFKPQIELGTTATAYTPYFSDFSTVKVSRYGKNLIPFPYRDLKLGTSTYNGVSFTVYEDGSILINGTARSSITKYLYQNTTSLLGLKSGITISCSKNASDATQQGNVYLMCNYYDSTGTMQEGITASTNASGKKTITDDWKGLGIYLTIPSGKTLNNLLIKPQLEIGTTATEYEPYKEYAEYTPTATGEATGIKVLSPTTNIINDKGLLFTKVTGDDFNYIN